MKETWFIINISYLHEYLTTFTSISIILNKITNVIMLTIYNPIGTSFVCGFQMSNKKSLYYTCFQYH